MTQTDIEELIHLRRMLDEAHERWVSKREQIRSALVAGADVEPGIHWVKMLQDDELRRLVVR